MTPSRSGRPAGNSDTRSRILDAARTLFAAKGFQQTTLRAVATEAGVDVALISHYFDNKRGLFVAVVELPVDPAEVIASLDVVPVERIGSELLRHLLTIWSSPAGPGLIAVFRSSLGGEPELLRDFITTLVMPEVRARLETTQIDDLDRRLPLAATQLVGVMALRHLLQIDPVASMPVDDLVRTLGPNVDRLLTGTLD